jgi:uncharacterized membrane protein YfcA
VSKEDARVSFEFWFMFPVSIGIATVAMASGVEGATFFAPVFILALGLSPEIAIGTGLITEVFGFSSGLAAYVRKKLIDFRLGGALLVATIPAAILGTWVSGRVDPDILKVVLGMGLIGLAMSFLRSPGAATVEREDAAISAAGKTGPRPQTCLTTAEGETLCYTVVNRTEGRMAAAIGALFMGMVSTGLGEMNGYLLLQRCRVPSRVAVATSVFVVAVSAVVAASGHMITFVTGAHDSLGTVLSLIIFTVPGVVIGGQIGPALGSRISQHVLEKSLGILFVLIGGLMLGQVLLG